MAFSFLLPVSTYPDPTPKAGLGRAFDLAATMTGRITALIHEVDIPPIHNVLTEILMDVSELAAAAEARSRENGRELAGELRHLAGRFRLPLEVRQTRSRLELEGDAAAKAARAFDFALLVPRGQSDGQSTVVEAVLFDSGGPVIVFPEQDAPAHLKTVAIAWDGSRTAARAVRDAIPVLVLAKHTLVITVGDDKPIDHEGLTAMLRLLSEHDIDTEHLDVRGGGLAIGDSLQQTAISHDAGLLVMGAYGHTRLREFVFGGATRTVLADLKLPILMSH